MGGLGRSSFHETRCVPFGRIVAWDVFPVRPPRELTAAGAGFEVLEVAGYQEDIADVQERVIAGVANKG